MTNNANIPKLSFSYNISKFNKILIEVISVMFAVLVALGVDQWWEERENIELGNKLKADIELEIQKNLEEIKVTHENYSSTGDTLLIYLAKPEVSLDSVKINLGLAILTSATWHMAQMLRAIHYMDYEWVIKVAAQYELQDIYLETQKQFLDVMGRMAEEDAAENPKKLFRSLAGRLMILTSLQEGLIEGYTDLLNKDDSGDLEE